MARPGDAGSSLHLKLALAFHWHLYLHVVSWPGRTTGKDMELRLPLVMHCMSDKQVVLASGFSRCFPGAFWVRDFDGFCRFVIF